MSFNLKDPISTPKAYENWLKILAALTVICGIATAVSAYKIFFTDNGDAVITILLAFTTAMFYFARREKASAPRPGSAEYEAIERQHQAQIEAGRERRYLKQHPHQVARQLVKDNKVADRISYQDEKKNKK